MALYLSLPDPASVAGLDNRAGSFSAGLLGVWMVGKVQAAVLSGGGGGGSTVETLWTGTGAGDWTAGPAKSPKSSSLSSREAGWD